MSLQRVRSKCDPGGRLSDLISCESQAGTLCNIRAHVSGPSSQGSTLDLYVAPQVFLPSRRIFRFLIQGEVRVSGDTLLKRHMLSLQVTMREILLQVLLRIRRDP